MRSLKGGEARHEETRQGQEMLTTRLNEWRGRGVLAIFVLLAWMVGVPLPSAAQTWPNQPAGATVLQDVAFNQTLPPGWIQMFGCNCSIVSDPTAPHSPNNVLEGRRNSDQTGGSDSAYILPSPSNDIYVGYWIRPSNPFYGWSPNGPAQNKHLLIDNVTDGHTYVSMFDTDGVQGPPFNLGSSLEYPTVTNGHLPGAQGGVGATLIFASANMDLGQWQRLEVYLKKSTTPSSRDGIYRLWKNGNLIRNDTNVNFPSAFLVVWFTQIWDSGIPLPGPESYRYDHARIAVGGTSGGGGGGDTTPPTQPTGLTATPLP